MPKEMITMRLSRASGQPWGFVIVGGKDQVSLLLYLEPGITRNNLKSLKPFFFPFLLQRSSIKKNISESNINHLSKRMEGARPIRNFTHEVRTMIHGHIQLIHGFIL